MHFIVLIKNWLVFHVFFLFIFFLFDVVLLNIVASSKILKVYHDYMASSYHMGIVSGFTLMSSYLESVESTGKTVCVTVLLSISFFSEMILCSNNSVSSEKDCFSQTIHDLLCLTNDLFNQMGVLKLNIPTVIPA